MYVYLKSPQKPKDIEAMEYIVFRASTFIKKLTVEENLIPLQS